MKLEPELITSTPDGIYDPREDTFLLLDTIVVLPEHKTALEVGCGNGLISRHLAFLGLEVTAVDINPDAVVYCENVSKKMGLSIEHRISDMFSNVTGKFDIIIFNPPYLPDLEEDSNLTEQDRWALIGGKEGWEVANKFLTKVSSYLSSSGVAYSLVISDNFEKITKQQIIHRITPLKMRCFENEALTVITLSKRV